MINVLTLMFKVMSKPSSEDWEHENSLQRGMLSIIIGEWFNHCGSKSHAKFFAIDIIQLRHAHAHYYTNMCLEDRTTNKFYATFLSDVPAKILLWYSANIKTREQYDDVQELLMYLTNFTVSVYPNLYIFREHLVQLSEVWYDTKYLPLLSKEGQYYV